MTIYYSERNPFLYQEIVLYVLPLNNKAAVPANLYNSKPEEGHCFGSLETALKSCRDTYHYKIIVKAGTYNETINIEQMDLSKVRIIGEVNREEGEVIHKNGSSYNWSVSFLEPTVERLNSRFRTVFTKGIFFNKCSAPSIEDIYFNLEENETNPPKIQFSKCTSVHERELHFYVNDPNPKLRDTAPCVHFFASNNILIGTLFCFSDRGIFVDTNSSAFFSQAMWLESYSDYNTAEHNYTPPQILRVDYSRLSFRAEVYSTLTDVYKTIKDGRFYINSSSKVNLPFNLKLRINNESFINKPDNTLNRDRQDSYMLTINAFSSITSSRLAEIEFIGGNRLLGVTEQSTFDIYNIKLRGPYIHSGIFCLNGSTIKISNETDIYDSDIKDFCVSRFNSLLIFIGDIKSTTLSSNKPLPFRALNKSEISFGPNSDITGNGENSRLTNYVPLLNSPANDDFSQIYKLVEVYN